MNNPASTPSGAAAPRRWRRAARWLLGLAVVAVVAGGGWYGWQRFSAPPDPTRDLLTSVVQRGDFEDLVTATGTLQPRDYVDVGAQVSGQLKKIHVEIGSVVKAGDLLAEIDPTLYLARVDASRAQLRNLRAQMIDREAQLQLAQINFKRQTNLRAADATTEEALQNAQAALRSATAQIEMLKAQTEQVESTLRAEEANLNYARIFAPMAGTVVSITARQGQTLNANQQAPVILRIADLSTMTVQTQVSEADVSRLRLSMPVYFTTLGSQGRRWYGELYKIEPTPVIQNNVVLYNALFDVPNPNQMLMTSMTAQVFFVAASARDALLVPMSALSMSARPQRGPRAEGAQGSGGVQRPEGTPRGEGAQRPEGPPRGEARQGPEGTQRPEGAQRPDRTARADPADAAKAGAAKAGAAAAGAATAGASATGARDSARGAGAAAPTRGGTATQTGTGAATQTGTGAATQSRASTATQTRAGAATAVATQPGDLRRVTAGPRDDTREAPRPPRRATVRVVAEDGTISERQVTVGISNRVQAQILSGLSEGERVVTGSRQSQPQSGQRTQGGAPPPGMFGGAPRLGR